MTGQTRNFAGVDRVVIGMRQLMERVATECRKAGKARIPLMSPCPEWKASLMISIGRELGLVGMRDATGPLVFRLHRH